MTRKTNVIETVSYTEVNGHIVVRANEAVDLIGEVAIAMSERLVMEHQTLSPDVIADRAYYTAEAIVSMLRCKGHVLDLPIPEE